MTAQQHDSVRLDRYITLSLVQPFRRGIADTSPQSPDHALPILMYHSVTDRPETGVHPYYQVCTSPEQFRKQMRWLKDSGYRGVTLSQGFRIKSETPKAKLVALTFDDGLEDFYTQAWPILQQTGFNATMYLSTAFVGETRRRFAPVTTGKEKPDNPGIKSVSNCLIWSEVNEMHRAGMEFGSHTVRHPKLVELTRKEIQSELGDSKSDLENHLGTACTSFAYPYAFPETNGQFVADLKRLLIDAGYENCVTTRIGRARTNDDPFQLKRLPVNSADDASLFQAKIEGAYDWAALPQFVSKTIKGLRSRSAHGLQ